jgi:hypothetical protein
VFDVAMVDLNELVEGDAETGVIVGIGVVGSVWKLVAVGVAEAIDDVVAAIVEGTCAVVEARMVVVDDGDDVVVGTVVVVVVVDVVVTGV